MSAGAGAGAGAGADADADAGAGNVWARNLVLKYSNRDADTLDPRVGQWTQDQLDAVPLSVIQRALQENQPVPVIEFLSGLRKDGSARPPSAGGFNRSHAQRKFQGLRPPIGTRMSAKAKAAKAARAAKAAKAAKVAKVAKVAKLPSRGRTPSLGRGKSLRAGHKGATLSRLRLSRRRNQ
jgi:hypothetical protein